MAPDALSTSPFASSLSVVSKSMYSSPYVIRETFIIHLISLSWSTCGYRRCLLRCPSSKPCSACFASATIDFWFSLQFSYVCSPLCHVLIWWCAILNVSLVGRCSASLWKSKNTWTRFSFNLFWSSLFFHRERPEVAIERYCLETFLE